jgi:hypothetical protein
MALSPIAFTIPNYRDYKNYWLKAYIPATTTPKVMALDKDGVTTVAKLQLNKDGFPESAGGALVIPYIDGSYDLYAFPTEAEADANDTSNALRFADDISAGIDFSGVTRKFNTLEGSPDSLVNASDVSIGDTIYVDERTEGNGGCSIWSAVDSATVTPNTFDIVISIAQPTIAFVIKHQGVVNILAYGLVADGTKGAATGTDNSLAFQTLIADQSINKVTGSSGVFFFGELGLDEILATRTTNKIDIDWGGAYLTVAGDNSIVNTGMAFLRLSDVNGSMINFEFEDVNFNIETSTGRGVMPFQIYNEFANTEGYSCGHCKIHKGQSLLTCFGADPSNFQASVIALVGDLYGDEVYYGVNCANNGNDIHGNYRVNKVYRGAFLYGMRNADLTFKASEGQPSSANLLISNSGGTNPPTENIKIRAIFESLNGGVAIADQPALGDGVYRNIDIEVAIKAIGSNLTLDSPIVRFGAFDTDGVFLPNVTTLMEDIRIDLKSDLAFTQAFSTLSRSPNYGVLTVPSPNKINDYLITSDWLIATRGRVYNVAGLVNPNANSVEIDSKFVTGVPKNGVVSCVAHVTALNGTLGSPQTIASYWVQGSTSSTGALTIFAATEISSRNIGGITPVITIDANGNNIRASVDNQYTDPNGSLKLSLERF